MSSRAAIKRHPERAVPDEASAILAEGMVAHVAFCEGGQPFVIPLSYHYDPQRPDEIVLHGANDSRLMQYLAAGNPVALSVTLLDGLVYSRTAVGHAMNYRSIVCFGRVVSLMPDAEKEAFFAAMTERYFPGRRLGHDYAPAPAARLHDTLVATVRIEESSAKSRKGGPLGPYDNDPTALGEAGVINLKEHQA
jgi:uncharacterized protein